MPLTLRKWGRLPGGGVGLLNFIYPVFRLPTLYGVLQLYYTCHGPHWKLGCVGVDYVQGTYFTPSLTQANRG